MIRVTHTIMITMVVIIKTIGVSDPTRLNDSKARTKCRGDRRVWSKRKQGTNTCLCEKT